VAKSLDHELGVPYTPTEMESLTLKLAQWREGHAGGCMCWACQIAAALLQAAAAGRIRLREINQLACHLVDSGHVPQTELWRIEELIKGYILPLPGQADALPENPGVAYLSGTVAREPDDELVRTLNVLQELASEHCHREVGVEWINDDDSVSYIEGPLLVSGSVPAHAKTLEFLSRYGRVKIWRQHGNNIVGHLASLTPLVTHTPADPPPPTVKPSSAAGTPWPPQPDHDTEESDA